MWPKNNPHNKLTFEERLERAIEADQRRRRVICDRWRASHPKAPPAPPEPVLEIVLVNPALTPEERERRRLLVANAIKRPRRVVEAKPAPSHEKRDRLLSELARLRGE